MVSVSAHGTGPRFLIADDHAMFAEALRVYLEKTYAVVGVVSNGRIMVAEAMRLRPDVIAVDVGMPLLNGLDAARKIKELGSRHQVHHRRPHGRGALHSSMKNWSKH